MRTTRRVALTASGVVTLGLAGCSEESPPTGTPPTTSGPPEASGDATTPAVEPDPDRAALERAYAITSALAEDLAASKPAVDIGGELTGIHRAHLVVLEEAAGDAAPLASVVPGTGRALTPARLRRRELAAQRELAALAAGAEGGAVARLLASMSAGVAAGLSHRGEVPR